MPWKVKSAKVKGNNLVVLAEREIPLNEILKGRLLEEVEEVGEPQVEEPEEPKEPGVSEEKLERMQKIQNDIESVEMETERPVSKIKGQKGMILASVEAGNESLQEIAKDVGTSSATVSFNLTWLVKNNFIKRTGRGQYEITKRGENYLRKLGEGAVE